MNIINQELIDEGVPIAARQISGFCEACKKLQISMPLSLPERPPKDGCFEGIELGIRIKQYFEKIYGEKLKIDFSPGSVVVLIEGDIYKINLPKIYGQFILTADPRIIKTKELKIDGKPALNVLAYIEGITDKRAEKLTDDELKEIVELFIKSQNCFELLRTYRGNFLFTEIIGDFSASTQHLVHNHPQIGLSRWSSLQALEKTIKAFTKSKGLDFKQVHILREIAIEAEKAGLKPLPRTLLDIVQCSPSIRYESSDQTIKKAVAAQHVAIDLCFEIVQQIIKSG